MGGVMTKLLGLFWSKSLEVVMVGLENSGKTTLLNVLASGMTVETAPTIGLNVKQVKKGGTTLKVWDIGGQKQYRSEWRRYTKGCDVIIFVVDAYAHDQIGEARVELHRLLEDRDLATTPILVCSNKVDLEPHISEHELIKSLNLDYLIDNPWLVIPISALRQVNVTAVLDWLVKQAK